MEILSFDELNKLSDGEYNRKSMPYEQYFVEMELSQKQKENRIAFANDFERFVIFLFVLIGLYGNDKDKIIEAARQECLEVIEKYAIADSAIRSYVDELINQTVDVTLQHIDEAYFISVDRAMLIAENEANTVLNYDEWQDAISAGYTRKKWHTEKDWRVRKTHRAVESIVIDIEDAFLVGESLMQFPKDTSYGADGEEIVNCRCTVEYLK